MQKKYNALPHKYVSGESVDLVTSSWVGAWVGAAASALPAVTACQQLSQLAGGRS